MTFSGVRFAGSAVAVHPYGAASRVRALMSAAGAHRPFVASGLTLNLALGLLLGLIRPFAA